MNKKIQIKLCIFDLDGVIVNTAKYHYLAWKKLASTFGYNLTKKQNEKLKGVNRVDSLNLILKWAGKDVSEDKKAGLRNKKNNWYVEMIEGLNPKEVLPGAKNFVIEVKKHGIKTAIGSSSKNTPKILKQLEITELFDAIVDGNMITNGKPHPEVFLKGAEKLNISPKNTLVFEDAASGVDAALAGGMYAVGVGTDKALNHAHFVIPNLKNFGYSDLTEKINHIK